MTHDSYEISEYMALEALEPVNFNTLDFWNSQMAYMVYAVNAGKDQKFEPYDFSMQKIVDTQNGIKRLNDSGQGRRESFYQKMIDAGLIEKKPDGNYGYSEVGKQRLARNRN